MNRQRINLYQKAPRRVDLLSANGLACMTAGLVAVLGLVSAGLAWQTSLSEQSVRELTASSHALEANVAQLRSEVAAFSADQEMQSAINLREQRLADGTRLLAGLGERISESTPGFSSVLASLAREPLDGVWLQRIVIGSEGGLLFEGLAMDADRIPRFVERLGQEPELIGREFRALRIERNAQDSGAVSFALVGMGVSDARDD